MKFLIAVMLYLSSSTVDQGIVVPLPDGKHLTAERVVVDAYRHIDPGRRVATA